MWKIGTEKYEGKKWFSKVSRSDVWFYKYEICVSWSTVCKYVLVDATADKNDKTILSVGIQGLPKFKMFSCRDRSSSTKKFNCMKEPATFWVFSKPLHVLCRLLLHQIFLMLDV